MYLFYENERLSYDFRDELHTKLVLIVLVNVGIIGNAFANNCVFFFTASTRRTPAGLALELFEQHQGTHILQVRFQEKMLK